MSNRILQNLVNGKWQPSKLYTNIYSVLNGKLYYQVPNTQTDELQPFIDSSLAVPKSGLHNPYKSPERYLMLGDVCFNTANQLHKSSIEEQIVNEISAVTGKTSDQSYAELSVTRKFLENFSGDQVRFLAKGFSTPGDHLGQISHGVRWPYGSVAIISPFNFPLEIPLLQLMGSLFMGNRPILKVDSRVSVVMDSILKLLHENGLPRQDVDFIHCSGNVMESLLLQNNVRMTQFTGSNRIAERLAKKLCGKVKLEGGGFDWKIIGKKDPEIDPDLVYEISTKDAYSFSGQKCSAQSLLFIHDSWDLEHFKKNLKILAAKQKMGPILSLSSDEIINHVNSLLEIDGSKLWFGNKKIQDKNNIYTLEYLGFIQPTAVFIPLEEINHSNIKLVTKEIFGPVQIVTSYSEIDDVLKLCEKIDDHLTAAVVSNDPKFVNYVLGNTVNGTTYIGEKARTTGAPQNHWFGPCGDPRSAGIGTPEAIIQTWSNHREIIRDE